MLAHAVDQTGNFQADQSYTFLYDQYAPTMTITTPINGSYATSFTLSSGTYTENESGMANVYVAIANNVSQFWNGSGPQFAGFDSVLSWRPATINGTGHGFSSWTFTDSSLSAYIAARAIPETFTFYVRGLDVAGNDSLGSPSQPATGGAAQTYDFFPPSVGFTAPPANSILNGNAAPLTGTASDQPLTTPGAGVQEVRLSAVKIDSAGGRTYWDGSTWNGSPQGFNMTTNPSPAWGQGQVNVTWANQSTAINEASFLDGYSYQIIAQGHDVLGNYAVAYATESFFLDLSTPTVTLLNPVPAAPYISTNTFAFSSGTFTDPVPGGVNASSSGVQNVFVQIQDVSQVPHSIPSGQSYWTGIGNTWQGGSASSTTAVYQSSWSIVTALDWTRGDASPDGRQYAVRVYAQDKAGNAGIFPNYFTKVATVTFDGTAPLSGIVSPAPFSKTPSLAVITGTALDPLVNTSSSDVQGVYVSILDNGVGDPTQGFYWNGAGFASNLPYWLPTVYVRGTGTWTLNNPGIDAFLRNGSNYVVLSSATDYAGNVQIPATQVAGLPSYSTYTFQPPPSVVAITGPASLAHYNELTNFGGTNNANTVSILLSLERADTGQCWGGTALLGWVNCLPQNSTNTRTIYPAGLNWSYPPANEVVPDWSTVNNTTMTLTVAGVNAAAIVETPAPNVEFFIDRSSPTSTVQFPASGAYLASPPTLSGQSIDFDNGQPGPIAAGVGTVSIFLQRLDTNNYWSVALGTWTPTVTASTVAYNTVSLGWTFTSSTPTLTWQNGLAYSLQVFGQDLSAGAGSGNTEVPGAALTFHYDATKPGVALTAPIIQANDRETAFTMAATSGTSSAAAPDTVALVQVRYRDVNTGLYANPAGGGFNIGSTNAEGAWSTTTFTGSWATWHQSSGTLFVGLDGSTFTVEARAFNQAGSYSSPYATGTFVYDSLPPQSAVQSPANGLYTKTLPSISGTAADLPAGNPGAISAENLEIIRLADGNYWSGASWGAVPVVMGQGQGVQLYVSSWAVTAGNLPVLTSGDSYYITSQGVDNADGGGNAEAFFNARGSTFTYDNTPPVTGISNPLDGVSLNNIPSVSGAGFDNVSVSTVQLSLQDTSIGSPNCYNPSFNTFSSACPAFFGAKGSTTAWTFSFPASQPWTHAHHYVLISSATDLAANVQTSISSATFFYDVQAPTAAVVAPILLGYLNPSQVTISGTATDSPAGMSSLQLALSSGPANWAAAVGGPYTSPSPVYFSTVTYSFGAPDSWTWAPDTATMVNGQNYDLRVKSTDKAGNSQAQDFGFLYDTAPAIATMTFPANGQFAMGNLTFTGGSYDPVGPGGFASGVSTVAVALQDTTNGKYYVWGGAFTSAAPVYTPAFGAPAAWTLTPPAGVFTQGHSYWITSEAFDVAGNVPGTPQFAVGTSSNLFTYDNAIPLVGVASPIPQAGDRENLSTLVTLSGTASDPLNALAVVQIRVRQNGVNYWNPSSSDYTFDVAPAASETAWFNASTANQYLNWTSTSNNIPFTGTDGTSYQVIARSLNKAGGYSTAYASNTFVFDSLPPQTGVVTPANGLFTNALPQITGTAQDYPLANPGTISAVGVRLERLSDGNYWTGTLFGNWTSGQTVFTIGAVQGVSVWVSSYTLPGAYLPATANNDTINGLQSGDSYYITTSGTDNVDGGGNSEAFGSVRGSTFVFDDIPPVTGISNPLSGTFLNSEPSVSGAGFDNVLLATVAISVQDLSSAGSKCYNPSNNTFSLGCPNWFGAKGSTAAWSYSFAVQPWTHNHQYLVISSGTDAATNPQVVLSSASFTFDIQAPTATVTTPGVSGTLNPTQTSFVGTSTDAPAGVASLQLALSSGAGLGNWLTNPGHTFTSASPVYFTTTTYVVGIPDNWTMLVPGGVGTLTDGQNYDLRILETDRATNSRTQDFTFLYDASPAIATVTFPVQGGYVDGNPTISGGAYDPAGPGGSASGVAGVQVSILSTANNKCLVAAGGFTSGTCPNWIPTTGPTANWTYQPSPNPFVTGVSYVVLAQGTDNAGNVQSTFGTAGATISSVTFTYDTGVPMVYFQMPTAVGREQNLTTLSGTATDSIPTDLAVVQIRVQDTNGLNQYADPGNGMAFDIPAGSADTAWFNAASNSVPLWTSWSVSSGIPFASGHLYNVEARVRNQANGYYGASYSTQAVVFDNTAPFSETTLPVLGSTVSAIPMISGTAFDQTGSGQNPEPVLSDVRVRLIRLADGNFWNGVSWQGSAAQLNAGTGVLIYGATSTFELASNLPAANNLSTGLQDGDSYYITTSGLDNADPGGNAEVFYTPARASTFTVDLTGPSLNFTAPANGSIISSLTPIRGTATDNLAGISYTTEVFISLSENGPGFACWNGQITGGTFTAAACATPYYPISNAGIGGTFVGGVWQLGGAGMPPLTSLYNYKALIKGVDNATPTGNVTASGNIQQITFTYNTNFPSAGIKYPPSLPASGGNLSAAFTIAGTASDNFGVAYTSVAYQESNTLEYWNPATSTFSSLAPVWIGATPVGSPLNPTFTQAAPVPAASSGRDYSIYVYVANTAGLTTITPAITIDWDTTQPVSAVVTPATGAYVNAVSSVTGTASDPGALASGITAPGGTQLQLERKSDLTCWNGASWQSVCGVAAGWLTAVPGPSWAVASGLPPMSNSNGGFQDGLSYLVTSRSFDVAANTQTVLTSNIFTVDLTSPTGGITFPANGNDLNSVPFIAGTAQDAAPGLLAAPQVLIENIPLGTFYNGAGAFALSPTWLPAAFTPTQPTANGAAYAWQLNAAAVPWSDGFNAYLIEVKTFDSAGNWTLATSTFSFDHTAPQSALTYPPSSGLFFSSMTAILGTAYDQTSPVPNVSAHMWYVSAGTTYYFTPAVPHWTTTDGGPITIAGAGTPSGGVTSPWTFNSTQINDFNTPGSGNFVWHNGTNDGADGHTFFIVSIASDAAGNKQVAYSTVSFTFDNVPPLSGPSAPINGAAYTNATSGPAPNSLPALTGTAVDDVSGVGGVYLAVEDLNAPAGTQWYDGSNFTQPGPVNLNVLGANLFPSSWTYTNAFLNFTSQHHYVVVSTATDNVGNVQNITGSSEFLFDSDPPTSGVSLPLNLITYTNQQTLVGTAQDPNFTSGIAGGGSGVYPGASPTWQKGQVQVAVYQDTVSYLSGGPIALPLPANAPGYFWNGSTWVANSGTPIWLGTQYTDALGHWTYGATGNGNLVCTSTSVPCWNANYTYATWSRAIDNAGNAQGTGNSISAGPHFFISNVAQSFLISPSTPVVAGNSVQVTVTAMDGPNGSGAPARSYAGTVDFLVDPGYQGTSGPEVMGASQVPDGVNGLPSAYTFTTGSGGDNGQHTFNMILRKAGNRTLRVQDSVNASLAGSNTGVLITTNVATQVILIADTNATCSGGNQQPGPGVTTPGSQGRIGTPQTYLAGTTIIYYCAQVVDAYYNLIPSSAATITITDSDPNNAAFTNGADQTVSFSGQYIGQRGFVTANLAPGQTLSATGAGTFPNAANPSTPIPIQGGTAQQLVAVMPGETQVPGKFAVAPFGKSGTIAPALAGSSYTATVYAVDTYYNPDPSAVWPVSAKIISDSYSQVPPVQTLSAGTTAFAFYPVVVGTQTVEVQSALAPASTYYAIPNPFQVWWSTPTKIQIVSAAAAETAAPGKTPYDANPTTGGRTLGTPAGLTAGVTTTITVNLVDNYFNVTKGTTPFVTYTSSFTMPLVQVNFLNDPNIQGRAFAPNPFQRTLSAGTTAFSFFAVTRNPAGLQVQAVDTGLTGTTYSTDTVTIVPVNSSSPVSMLVAMPGQTYAEGTVAGETGSPSTLVAGSSYTINVRAVDLYNNKASDGRQIGLLANDVYAGVPAPQALALGQTAFNNFLPSAATGNLVIQAYDDDVLTPKLATVTLSGLTVIPAAPTQLIVLLAGQTLVPGKVVPPFGVTGTPTASTAGVTFPVTAYATDLRYNVVNTVVKPTILFTSDDPFVASLGASAMASGSASPAPPTLRTAGTRLITAADGGGGGPALGAGVSAPLPLLPNNPTHLRLLTPSETAVPGSLANGRTGPTYNVQAGFSFQMEVDIVDGFWNLTPGTTQLIKLVSDDPFATITPASGKVVAGSTTFTVTLARAGNTVMTAEMVYSTSLPSVALDSATAISVLPGIPTALLTILPGESFSQGNPNGGKSGTPNPPQTAGTAFSVQVGVVDAFFNLVQGRSATVALGTPTDPYAPAVAPVAVNTTIGATLPFPVTLLSAATGHYLSAVDFGGSGLSADPQSSTFTVVAAAPIGLQLLLPGQAAVPGSGSYPNGGVAGSISTPTAGAPFNAVVNLVDQYMNIYNAGSEPPVYLNLSDPYSITPATTPLINGSLPVAIKLVSKTNSATVQAAPRAQAGDAVCTGNPPTNICLAPAPAAISNPFKVFASTATSLQIIMPGETQHPGKCTVSPGSVCRVLQPSEGLPGKDGTPNSYVVTSPATSASVYLVDAFFNPVSDVPVGPNQDTNPPAVMPTVQVSFPQDSPIGIPAAGALVLGNRSFSFSPLTASNTYTIFAATTAASASTWPGVLSAQFPVFPGPAHYMEWSNLPAGTTAGVSISGTLSVYDQFNNILSTGPNAFNQTATLAAQLYGGIQDPVFNPSNVVSFSTTNMGTMNLNSFLTLKKAGSQFVSAFETVSPGVNTSVPPSVQPFILVSPAAPDSVLASPLGLTQVSAGSLVPSSPGREQLSGQLTDAFANPITAATTVYLQIVNVSGATGYLALDYGSGPINVGASTTVYTSTIGVIGSSPAIYYYVSSHAGDYASVWMGTQTAPTTPAALAPYVSTQKDITGEMLTIGGAATQIVFLSSQPAALVGITNSGSGAAYTIETLDDFGNVTSAGWPGGSVFPKIVDAGAHTANGYTAGTFGTTGDYGFRDQGNTQFIASIPLPGTVSQASFRYHDKMSSYSGPGPSSNTAVGGRPGLWIIQILDASNNVKASASLAMNPDAIDQVGFNNPPNTEVAGTVLNAASLASFQAQLEDEFTNPSVATQTVAVALSTITRMASRVDDYTAFSLSSNSFVGTRTSAPAFFSTTATLTVPLGQYQTTFYYMDTTATSLYASGGGTKPVIGLSSPGLFSNQQAIAVLPNVIDGIAITTGANQPLLAGATSSVYVFETRDIYGNPSPLAPGQDFGRGWVQLEIQSDSLGSVSVSTPNAGAFVSSSAVSYLDVGTSATTFFLIDTLLTQPGAPHHLSVSGITYPNWAVAVTSYTVAPGPPVQIQWATAPRRLVAGTTTELILGVATNTVVAVQLVDQYNNVTNSTQTYFINYNSPGQLGAYGGINGSAVIVATAPSSLWTNLGIQTLSVAIPGGASLSQAPMYFWDTTSGGATVYAQAQANGFNVFPQISQVEQITPGPANYLTFVHPYTTTNPLPVGHIGLVTLQARDLFGNIATGDSQNGNYFTDTVDFWSSGSTNTVTLQDPGTNSNYHVFVATDAGVFPNVEVQDTYFEVLEVGATDFVNPSIYGFTNDGSRTGLPAVAALRSSPNVQQAGIVITPTDLAPESDPPPSGPEPPAKIGFGVPPYLVQGEGTSPSPLNVPIPMMRLSMTIASTLPTGLLANLSSMRVQSSPNGNLNNAHVTELALYYDTPGTGIFNATADELLSTGAYDNAGDWFFGNPAPPYLQTPLNVLFPGIETTLTGSASAPKNYFLTVRIASAGFATNELPASFGLVLPTVSNVGVVSSSVGVALNNFAIVTATSAVEREPAQINVSTQNFDINAFEQPLSSMPLAAYPYIYQGTPNVGVMAVKVWTSAFSGTISQFTVHHAGTGLDADIGQVRLYLDTQPNQTTVPGDGVFEFGIDKQIGSATFPAGETRQTTIFVSSPTTINGTVTTSTNTYFLVWDINPTATPGLSHGMFLNPSDIVPLSGNGSIVSFSPIQTSTVPILATPNLVILTAWDSQGISTATLQPTNSIPSKMVQADVDDPVAKITLQANSGAAFWTGLKLDRWLPSTIYTTTGNYNPLLAQNNSATDVANIRVWIDSNNDGLLEAPNSTDTQVSPVNAIVHNFPSAYLSVPVYSSGPYTGVSVTVVGQTMYPSDSGQSFPGDTYNRLILNDGQTDETQKEVVYCYGLNISNPAVTTFQNCNRGQEGSGYHTYSTSTLVSGPARIPIEGLSGGGSQGQAIGTIAANYFVSFDMSPLANVSAQANLGIAIPATNYFAITTPKVLSTQNVGLQAFGGLTQSFISNVAQYPNAVHVVSTDTVDPPIGPFLQQQSTVAITALTFQDNVSNAQLRWILVTATGTAVLDSAPSADVSLVEMWYDAPNSGIFNPGTDILVGTGTFGNYNGQALVAQVNMTTPITVLPTPTNRYFITYVMSPTAQPTDPITQAPRYLGAAILATSLPTGSPVVDNVGLNAVNLPNFYDTNSPLPYVTRQRQIIPSPQVMSVVATPYFSTSSGTFTAPYLPPLGAILDAPAPGAIDAFWLVSSTQGLPVPAAGTTAYLLIDNEIVGYTSNSLNASPTAIQQVVRGQLNTVPSTHTAGAYIAPQIAQGQNNVAGLRLDMWSSLFQVQLAQITLNRSLPISMNGNDADVAAIRAYHTPGGVFHRDPATGLDVSDTQLGVSAFGQNGASGGRVILPINDPTLGNPGYMLVTSTPTTVYISFDVSPSAQYSYPTLVPPNEVTGVTVLGDPTRFLLTPSNAGHTTVFVGTAPVASPTFVLAPTINTVTATLTQQSGNSTLQNAKNVSMVGLTLKTAQNSATITQIKVDRIGSPSSLDSDITAVKIWQGADGSGVFDSFDATQAANGTFPYLMSFGNDTFSSGTVTINLKTPILVSTTPVTYFVTYDISQFAGVGNQEGVQILAPSYLIPKAPGAVVFASPPFDSNPLLTIQKVTSQVTVGVNDIAGGVAGVSQAQANVAMTRFNMATNIALAPWRSLRLERIGASSNSSKPQGRNTDVKFVRIWKDLNQNDLLDAADLNISEVNTTLVAAISSTTLAPFNMVVVSTQGFPVSNIGTPIPGTIFVNGAELMTFSGPGCQGAGFTTQGLDNATGYPCLAIASRGNPLGSGPTPILNLSAGVNVRKVDVFDQANDSDNQLVVTLNADQNLAPTAQTFFVAYDIGDAAVANDLVGLEIGDSSWVGMPDGDVVEPTLITGETRSLPLGTGTTTYPFNGSQIAITPITLSVGGYSNAPSGAGQLNTNVPILAVTMQANQDFVNVSSIRFHQLGTVVTSTLPPTGAGDAAVIKVWLDNGTGVFTPTSDALLGQLTVSTAGAFSNGVALVPLTLNGIPYLTVSTATALIYVTADINNFDLAGNSTLGHTLGFELAAFTDLLGANGAPIVASANGAAQPPIISNTVLIAPLTVPGISVSSALPPIIVTRAGPGYAGGPSVPGPAIGFPAYAMIDPIHCNNGNDPTNPRNDICKDSNQNFVPDQTKWMCPDGTFWCQVGTGKAGVTCIITCASPPLIDVNGDGRPDNFSIGESTVPNQVSLLGDGVPTTDLTGTGILDVDINKDGIIDMLVFALGSTKPQVRIGLNSADQGDLSQTAPDPGQGLIPTSWAPSSNQLTFNLPTIGTSGYYQVALGKYFDTTNTLKWSTFTFASTSGLSASAFRARSTAAPITAATLNNLTLNIPNTARLTQTLTQGTTVFTVDSVGSLTLPGLLYIGSEIVRAEKTPGGPANSLTVITQAGDPAPFTGRGLRGSSPIVHTSSEVVSDDAAILFAEYVSANGSVSPPQAMFVYRVDPNAPAPPGPANPSQGGPTYTVHWNAASEGISGVSQYEVQERGGDPANLSASIIWHTINIIPGSKTNYIVGDGSDFPGESPRPTGQFFTYRVRGISGSGVTSNWSASGAAANTGGSSAIISGVSNFPNPFDSRKGGNAGLTQITYTLNANSTVKIQIYDELGYLTKTINCPAGSTGGAAGINFVIWDGHNDAGALVSKGGYIARITVQSPGGTATAIRKIGVIH